MQHATKRGFTLIELLVVIAIIGLLSTVVLASLSSARAKSRDARRLSDLKQIANAVALIDTGVSTTAFAGCTAAGARATTCTTPDLSKFTDPSGSTTACTTTSGAACDYAVGKGALATAGADTGTWEVCVYLETKAGPLTTNGGMVRVDQNGNVSAGCN
ncbi:type II secretion system protein [bacterium]|nr:type II secretion system protein [bacterium]